VTTLLESAGTGFGFFSYANMASILEYRHGNAEYTYRFCSARSPRHLRSFGGCQSAFVNIML